MDSNEKTDGRMPRQLRGFGALVHRGYLQATRAAAADRGPAAVAGKGDGGAPSDAIDVEHAVTTALAESPTPGTAAHKVTRILCEAFGWDLGALWVVDDERLHCDDVWHAPDLGARSFEAATRSLTLERGEDLPGRAWADASPAWIDDAARDPSCARARAAGTDGLHGAVAVPIVADSSALGVIELLSRSAREPGPQLLRALTLMGSQFGQFMRRKQMEQQLQRQRAAAAIGRRATEELKVAILEAALDPIITVDEDGRVIDFNSAAEKTFGYERADVIDQRIGDLIVPPALRGRCIDAIDRLRETGGSTILGRTVELVGMRSDGGEFPVELSINRVNLAGRTFFTAYLRDISERKHAEATVAQLASLVRSSDDAIVGESLDGVITSWNAGAQRIFGYSQEEAVGAHGSMLVPPEQSSEVSTILERLQRGRSLSYYETVRVTKNGERIHVSLTTSPIKDREGCVTGIATIARNITERMAAEAKRAELEQQLHQSQKMEALGRLAGGVAHDFNNLLAVIINYANFLAEDLDESSALRDDVERIRKAGDSAVGLVRQLLLFSRRENVEPQIVDANQLVLGLEKLLRRTIGEDIKLETRLATDLSLTKIDPGQMEQVLMNLAVNARDAMPGGGTLSLDTSNASADEYFARQHRVRPGPYVRLAVSDTGSGMTDDVLAHIFEPFFTTKPQQEGTGLGLATVYAIVQESKGCITVRSEIGDGTTFNIYLPITDEHQVVHEDRSAPRRGNGETILVVEDEDSVRELAHRILSAHGYDVLTARSGKEALELSDGIQTLHLLLSDVIMPHMSGQELMRWLSQSKERFGTIFMSGYTDQAVGAHEFDEPHVSFLEKPFTAVKLLHAVEDMLEVTRAEPTIGAGSRNPQR
ncbi:MAG: PAS domain S-box protein [Actinomycetota bacterium]